MFDLSRHLTAFIVLTLLMSVAIANYFDDGNAWATILPAVASAFFLFIIVLDARLKKLSDKSNPPPNDSCGKCKCNCDSPNRSLEKNS